VPLWNNPERGNSKSIYYILLVTNFTLDDVTHKDITLKDIM